MATDKYSKKLKCTNVSMGLINAQVHLTEEPKKAGEAAAVKSGIVLMLSNPKDAAAFTPGEVYTVTIQ